MYVSIKAGSIEGRGLAGGGTHPWRISHAHVPCTGLVLPPYSGRRWNLRPSTHHLTQFITIIHSRSLPLFQLLYRRGVVKHSEL